MLKRMFKRMLKRELWMLWSTVNPLAFLKGWFMRLRRIGTLLPEAAAGC